MDSVKPVDIRRAAMDCLARREHSFHELVTKLQKKFPASDIIEEQVQVLASENLQSDERFAESCVRGLKNRGKGPRYIRQQLKQKGIASHWVECFVDGSDSDWYQLAASVYQKKFGDAPPEDHKDKARRIRFMQARGFDTSVIFSLLD